MRHGACSDGRLLAFLDGELAPREAAEVQSHLDACWDCRARLAELEEGVHAVARAFGEGAWYSAASLERSRRRLHDAIEAEPTRRRRLGRYLFPLAAASLAFAGSAIWYAARPQPRPVERTKLRPAPRAPMIPAAPAAAPPAPVRTAPVVIPAAPPADLSEVLLDVFEALHRAGACTAEQPSVQARDGVVRVRLLAATRERRGQIETELAALSQPALEAEITSMEDDAGARQEVVFLPGAGSAAAGAGRRIPVHDILVRRLHRSSGPAEREIRDFADSVLRSSELLNVQHRALLALAEAFPEAVEAALPEAARGRLRRLVGSHQAQMGAAEGILRSALEPLTGAPALLPGETPVSWQADTRTSAAPELHRRLTRLFAIPVSGAVPAADGIDELANLLGRPLVSGGTVLAGK